MPDSDTSAQEPITPASEAPAEATPIDYSNPNDLDFELSEEQEQAFVDQILKDGNYEAPAAKTPETPVEPVAPVTPVATPPAPEAPIEPKTPDAPTEITAPQTDDLWVEVEQVTTDELGEESTQTVKLIYDPNDPSSFIPDDFTARSTKQLAEIMDAKAEMAKLYDERKGEFDTAKANETAATQEKSILDAWDAEIKDLISAKLIDEPKLKPGDEGYTDDPSVKTTDAVFKFMVEKNEERAKTGLAPIGSFGTAFSMYQNDEKVKADAEAKKQEDLNTKTAGAMVGGGSAASGGSAEPKAYVSGSARNIWDVKIDE